MKTELSLLRKLKNEAIWLIIDPWQTQPGPYDGEYIDNVNDYFCKKINEYMHDVKHKFIVLNEKEEAHETFKSYSRIQHPHVKDKILDKNFKDIVYTGFHHGRCTIDRAVSGAKDMFYVKTKQSLDINIYFKRDLLCLLPHDSWLEMDEKSEKYGVLI